MRCPLVALYDRLCQKKKTKKKCSTTMMVLSQEGFGLRPRIIRAFVTLSTVVLLCIERKSC